MSSIYDLVIVKNFKIVNTDALTNEPASKVTQQDCYFESTTATSSTTQRSHAATQQCWNCVPTLYCAHTP